MQGGETDQAKYGSKSGGMPEAGLSVIERDAKASERHAARRTPGRWTAASGQMMAARRAARGLRAEGPAIHLRSEGLGFRV